MSEPEDLPAATRLGPDPHSYANYEAVTVEHIDLEWRVDFEGRALHGCVTHRLLRRQPDVTEVLFDTRGITVHSADAAGSPLPFDIPRRHAALGSCLRVRIPARPAGERDAVSIRFSTQREPDGLQWFSVEQTLGKRQPFVYSQFQAILARTGLPCMDTPAVKASVDYRVDVPSSMTAACGGIVQGEAEEVKEGGESVRRFRFRQPIKVPSYLIAVAAGDIRRLPVGGEGSRCYVWAEPELGPAAAAEFADMERWLATAERLAAHPYVWGTYELLVLPPFFPYGGMEHPNLTCVNRSLVVGDKSLVHVVMHEISHSWTGNLVTNRDWPDFWINEGFTRYLERAILGEVHGEDMRQFSARLGYGEFLNSLPGIEEEEHQMLRPPMLGIDPDDAFSLVPYEKGFALLYHLETLVGGREAMLGWIQKYIKRFAERTVSSEEVIACFSESFPEQAARVEWDKWLYGTGPAPVDPRESLGTVLNSKVEVVAGRWLEGGGEGAAAGDIADWHPLLVFRLLDRLIEHPTALSVSTLSAIDARYSFSARTNPEIQGRWLQLRLRAQDTSALPAARKFLCENGRMKYVKPVFRRMGQLARALPEVRAEVSDIADCCIPLYAVVLHRALRASVSL